MFQSMVSNKLFIPLIDELVMWFSCYKVVLVSQMPIGLGIVLLVNGSLVDVGGVLGIEEHEHFRIISISIVNILFWVVSYVN